MVNLQINDKIKVVINGREVETIVAGIERGFGIYSPIFVKFYIDWDEGPIEYRWPISEIYRQQDIIPYERDDYE